MTTLKEQIAECEREILVREEVIKSWKWKRNDLLRQRAYCKHVFSKPIKGLEHEGGACTECGINEVYARSNHIGDCSGA